MDRSPALENFMNKMATMQGQGKPKMSAASMKIGSGGLESRVANNEKKITTILKENSVHFDKIGIITKKDIIINSEPILTVDDLRDCNKTWLKEYMAS